MEERQNALAFQSFSMSKYCFYDRQNKISLEILDIAYFFLPKNLENPHILKLPFSLKPSSLFLSTILLKSSSI